LSNAEWHFITNISLSVIELKANEDLENWRLGDIDYSLSRQIILQELNHFQIQEELSQRQLCRVVILYTGKGAHDRQDIN
jgi:hypothetical protein